jgi:hypothetical protein
MKDDRLQTEMRSKYLVEQSVEAVKRADDLAQIVQANEIAWASMRRSLFTSASSPKPPKYSVSVQKPTVLFMKAPTQLNCVMQHLQLLIFSIVFGILGCSVVADVVVLDEHPMPHLLGRLVVDVIVIFWEAHSLEADKVLIPAGSDLCSNCTAHMVNGLIENLLW